MQDELKGVRALGWCDCAITPIGHGRYALSGSINERRNAEFVRIAPDVTDLEFKPLAIDWIDDVGTCRRYSPDARAAISSEDALLEIKPKGILLRDTSLRSKYEAFGRYLKRQGKKRFALLEWQWDGQFERNVALLTRYWNIEPESHAVDAFASINRDEVALDELFARVDRDFWPAVWAAVAKQHLVADWHAGPVTRQTMVSLPGVLRDPITLASVITAWWA
jgi:hypothetical protein